MNLKGYSAMCATLERRGYGEDAARVFDEMVRCDKALNGTFKIERILERGDLIPMTVTYDSARGWSCQTNWIAAHFASERVSSL